MILSSHQPNYLPYPGLLAKINCSDYFVYMSNVQFEKQSWQSRNKIFGSKSYLSIPINKKFHFKKISEIEVDNSKNWSEKHFKSLYFSYKKAPFFKNYIDFFEKIYRRKWKYLNDLNIEITNFLIKELDIKTKILFDTDFSFEGKKNERLIKMCNSIKCDSYLSSKGSSLYIELNKFKTNSINRYFFEYIYSRYNQYKREDKFESGLTIFDMLFFCGKEQTMKMIKAKENIKISKNWQSL